MFKRDPMTGLWRPVRRGLCSIMPGLGMMPPGFGARAGASGPVVHCGTQHDTGTDATASFTFGDFSALSPPAANRMLLAFVGAADDATDFRVSSRNLFGDTSPGDVDSGASASTAYMAAAMWEDMPSTVSGSVSVTFSEAIAFDQTCVVAALTGYSPRNLSNFGAVKVASGTSVTRSGEIVAAGGIVFMCCCKGAAGEPVSFSDTSGEPGAWTKIADVAAPDNNSRLAAAYKVFSSPHASVDMTATGGATATSLSLIDVSLAPP